MRPRLNKEFEVPVKSEQGSSIRTSCSNLKCDIYTKCQKDIARSITDEFAKHERIKTFTYLQSYNCLDFLCVILSSISSINQEIITYEPQGLISLITQNTMIIEVCTQ